jgi:hypothetical protein
MTTFTIDSDDHIATATGDFKPHDPDRSATSMSCAKWSHRAFVTFIGVPNPEDFWADRE